MNYFAVGLELVQFLQTLTDDNGKPLFLKVDFLQSLSDITENRQITPACYVVYRGDSVKDTAGRGERVQMVQRYSVILAVSHGASQINASDGVTLAGVIIPKLLTAIQAWQGVSFASPLKRVGGDNAGFSTVFSYYPFTFETTIFI